MNGQYKEKWDQFIDKPYLYTDKDTTDYTNFEEETIFTLPFFKTRYFGELYIKNSFDYLRYGKELDQKKLNESEMEKICTQDVFTGANPLKYEPTFLVMQRDLLDIIEKINKSPIIQDYHITTDNLTLNLSVTAIDPDNDPIKCFVSWGNGSNDEFNCDEDISHTYANAGEYNLSITAIDNKGLANTVHITQIIESYNQGNKLITKENKPLTISFSNTSKINGNCIINFGDGYSQEFTDECPNSVTHIYKKPGVYNLYLIFNNEKIEHKVVIVNNEDPNHWVGYVSSLNNYLEENEKVEDFYVDGRLYIAPSLSDKWYYWTNFRYVNNNSNINSVDGNDFTIVARIKNPSSEGGISCYDPGISVMGENGKRAQVTFMSRGCTYYAAIGAADWFQSGGSWNCNSENSTCEYADLSALGRDFSDWKVVKMQVKDKKVSVYYENEEIYTMTYKGSIGKLVGISISFKGSGSIDWVKIYNNEGVLVYSEDF